MKIRKMRRSMVLGIVALLSAVMMSCSAGDEENKLPGEGDAPPVAGEDKSFVEEDVAAAVIPSEGFYIANEGQYTTQTGGGAMRSDASLNYFGNNGKMDYRIYRQANSEEKLVVATHFSTIWGGNAYFVSREQATVLTVADAKTFIKKASINIPSVAGRAFTGITDKLGYLSSTQGVYKINLETMELGDAIEGIAGQVGNMCSTGKYVFAVASKAVYVIDVATSALKEKIDGDFWTLTRSKDGNIWVASKTEFLKINPTTLAQEKVQYPEGMPVAEDSNKNISTSTDMWNTWHAGSLCASTQSNVLYWANEAKTNFIKYTIDTKEAQVIFRLGKVDDDGDMVQMAMYRGAGMRVDPLTDKLVVAAAGRKYLNRVYVLKADGAVEQELVLRGGNGSWASPNVMYNYVWSPAMPVFQDVNLPQILIKRIVVTATKTLTIDLKEKVIDGDNATTAILHEVVFPENNLVTYTLTNDGVLTITAKEKAGTVDCKLIALSNGQRVEKTVKVDVSLD